MKPKVFISVGSVGTRRQIDASETIFSALETAGLSPRQMGKNEWSFEQPLRAIKHAIGECDGAVIIAFSRYYFPTGMEREKAGEHALTDIRLPTIWNHIEAAMAYMRDLPVLVIAEQGLKEDGLLRAGYDWQVYWTEFTHEELRSEAFCGRLDSWKRAVRERASRRKDLQEANGDPSKMSIAQLMGQLTVPQIWATVSAFLSFLIAVATIAFRAGAGKWPWQ